MAIHQVSKRDWPKLTWKYPRVHNFNFGFGLSAENGAKASTYIIYFLQDNALVDYENIKTNPENVDFSVVAYPNVCAGSYVPKVHVSYNMYIPPSDTEIVHLRVNTMEVGISMLNRLDAFDKKTGEDIESLLNLTHETTDEQCYPLFNGTKLFESGGVYDQAGEGSSPHFGLTTDSQPEGVAFTQETFFDAMHYYTNKEMLKTVTNRMRSHILSEPLVPHGRSIVSKTLTFNTPSLCKFQHPYTFCGELVTVPQVNTRSQYHLAGETTAIEHMQLKGYCRFYEYNPDFNFARA